MHSWVLWTRPSLLLTFHWSGLCPWPLLTVREPGTWILAQCPGRRESSFPLQTCFLLKKTNVSIFLYAYLISKAVSPLYRETVTQTYIFWGWPSSWLKLHDPHLVRWHNSILFSPWEDHKSGRNCPSSVCKLHLFFVNARSLGKTVSVWECVKSSTVMWKELGFQSKS